jgi:FtsP/CotA-like multicopper oxidase with cupredoxin domain
VNGTLKVALTAKRETIEVSGSPIEAQPFNGRLIGPTLHVRPGDTIAATIENATSEQTNIHYHGLHVSPKGISDNVFRTFEPGQTVKSVVHLPAGHEPGTYWYHVHLHGLTEEQVMGGMSGLLVVEGLEDRLPAPLQGIRERQLAIRDVQHQGDSIVMDAADIDPSKPTTRLVNGQLDPRIELASGETQLWRIANVGADLFYDVALDGHRFHVLAEDGSPVWEVTRRGHLLLPPGKRYDVLVQGGRPGDYVLRTRKYDEGFQLLPNVELAEVAVTGAAASQSAALPRSMTSRAAEDLSDAPIAREREFTFSLDTADGQFKALINGEVFDPDATDVAPELGTVEQWTLRNTSSEDHPFHIHVNDFQEMSVNGRPYDAHGLQDVAIIPKNGGEIVIRNPFEDFTGHFVFHCHILGHEDAGMMKTVEVVRPGQRPTPPPAGGMARGHRHAP